MKLSSVLTTFEAITAFHFTAPLAQPAKVLGKPQMNIRDLTFDALGYIENHHEILLDLNMDVNHGQ